MDKMKHQDGFAPSAEDTTKLNEFMSWLSERGYQGIVLIHKGQVGVSWVNEESADSVRHTLINSLSHIYQESEVAAAELLNGMVLAINQITK